MALIVRSFNRPEWSPLPVKGSVGVEAKGLARMERFNLAMLKFEPNATIHEHPADIDIDVFCLEGEGMTSVKDQSAAIHAGEWVRWPAGQTHRLWTENSPMVLLMIEYFRPSSE